MRKTGLGALAVLLPGLALAQTSPFVDTATERTLLNELSGDLAFETLRITTQWHKPSGSEGFYAVAREVEARAKAAGLQDVRWIDQVAQTPNWTCRSAEAWLLEGPAASAVETKIASSAEVATSIADNSRPAVRHGRARRRRRRRESERLRRQGRAREDRAGLRQPSALVTEQAVWKRGAAGILSWSSSRLNPLADSADQIAWVSVPEQDGPKGEKTTFAIVVSARARARPCRTRCGAKRRGAGERARRNPRNRCACVSRSTRSSCPSARPPWSRPASPAPIPTLPEIVLTAHLQEEKFSANDDQSGVANVARDRPGARRV